MSSVPLTRRAFLELTAAGLGGASLMLGCGRPASPYRFLSDAEAELVIALAEQIVPADESAGATEAGVVRFIDRQLVTHYKRFQPAYRSGLEALERTSQELTGTPFRALAWEAQTDLLQRIEQGDVPETLWPETGPGEFFRMIRDHSLQGFYGGPQHGGNANYVSYRMIGIDYPPVLGRHRPPDAATPT